MSPQSNIYCLILSGPPVSFKELSVDERQKSSVELDPVVLHCELSRPDSAAHWFKDGVELLQSENVTIQAEGTMRRLILRSAHLSDAGTYTCHAGDDTMSFTVSVKGTQTEHKSISIRDARI